MTTNQASEADTLTNNRPCCKPEKKTPESCLLLYDDSVTAKVRIEPEGLESLVQSCVAVV